MSAHFCLLPPSIWSPVFYPGAMAELRVSLRFGAGAYDMLVQSSLVGGGCDE